MVDRVVSNTKSSVVFRQVTIYMRHNPSLTKMAVSSPSVVAVSMVWRLCLGSGEKIPKTAATLAKTNMVCFFW